jgi:hypothetical protein
MKTILSLGSLLAAAICLYSSLSFSANPGTLTHRFSFPQRAATKAHPQVIELTIDVMGKPVKRTVMVTDIPAFVEPMRNAGETIQSWHDRVVAARAEASRVKASRIADAINMAFAAEFKALNKSVTVDVWQHTDRQYNNRTSFYGMIKIPSVQEDAVKNTKLYNWVNNQTQEPRGDALGFERGGSSMGAMGRPISGLTTFATGMDAFGEQSMVSFGISDLYVADYVPILGMSDEQVLQGIGAALTRQGLSTSYDSSLGVLVINHTLLAGQELVWGNSDPTLELSVFLLAVPEPTQRVLLLAGIVLVAIAVCHNRRRFSCRRSGRTPRSIDRRAVPSRATARKLRA